MKRILTRIAKLIDRSHRFLITAHERLDGDAVGSELAFWHLLVGMGKAPLVVNDGAVPSAYMFLEGSREIVDVSRDDSPVGEFDCVIVLDCPTLERTARVQQLIDHNLPSINIDHHPGNTNFALLNLVEEQASSSAELTYNLISSQNYMLTPAIAEALYAAILSDTGRFCFDNTTPGCLQAAAKLVQAGARPARVSEQLYQSYGPAQMKLAGQVLDTLIVAGNGHIACVSITEKMLTTSGVLPYDTQDFAEIPRMVKGTDVGVLLREMPDNRRIKVSLRSSRTFNVRAVAKMFGGGGHRQAAGCVIPGELEEVRKRVVAAIEAVFASGGVPGGD